MSWLSLNRFLQTDLVTDFVDQSGLSVSTAVSALWFRNDVLGVEMVAAQNLAGATLQRLPFEIS